MTHGKPVAVQHLEPWDLNADVLVFHHGDDHKSGLVNPKLLINGQEATQEEVGKLIESNKGNVIAQHRHHVNFEISDPKVV